MTLEKLKIAASGQKVTIYSVQHKDVLKTLTNKGFLSGNHKFSLINRSDWKFLKISYDWIKTQMSKRLKNYSGEYPVWGWLERPSLVHMRTGFGPDQVLITAEVPVERILLSDFDLFHDVIMGNLISYDVKKLMDSVTQINEKEYEAGIEKDRRYKYVPTQKELEDGWELIFDVTYKPKNKKLKEYIGLSDEGRTIQVCIDKIFLDEIINIKIIK